MIKKLFIFAIFLFSFLISIDLFALDGIEILSGYLDADLDKKEDYEGIPLLVALNYDVRPMFEKIGIQTQGRIDFILEPFINTITSPDSNIEVGANLLLKYICPLTERLQLYVKGGAGALYMSQHTEEQGTQYNFLPQLGAGIHLFLSGGVALSCEYRYRHLSNADIEKPNSGIDTTMILGGVSFFFD
ncbi:MAG: acyloxyacyl hydrolase [Candidatus Omnitrophota bacterium]|nr:MAG: acyloxyacyl hydrolase [Candidatus Omnitrophota bacterium]